MVTREPRDPATRRRGDTVTGREEDGKKYPAAFVSKLSDAEAEAAETQVWIEFAVRCGYLDPLKPSALE